MLVIFIDQSGKEKDKVKTNRFFIIFFRGPEKLTQILEAERESPSVFQALPFHYIEISRLLFDQ